MKRLYYAVALCLGLLIFEAAVFLPSSMAKEDVVAGLLELPAPPPPNPLVRGRRRTRDDAFYNTSKPPADDAPIDELLDYWAHISERNQELRYSPEPSDKVRARLMNEIEGKPELLSKYLNLFKTGAGSAEFVKNIFDREGTAGVFDRDGRSEIKDWLTLNTSYFSSDLYRMAAPVGDTETYISNHRELLALARVDFDRARPLIDRLQMGGSRKASRALAAWANYIHAIETNSLGDIERYRDELKSIVEDKTLPGPMRDLAMDGLVSEKEWSGRDDWYISLLADETLANLGGYTGLTTLILVSPDEKYIDKMIKLLDSDNPVVRAAAVRNLLTRINTKNPDIIRAMLPWLEDKGWAKETNEERRAIINALRELKIPESVPGLIKVLDEKGKAPVYGSNANRPANISFRMIDRASISNMAVANAVNAVANAAASTANAVSSSRSRVEEEAYYPYRSFAIWALTKQEDLRAAPALRRILPEVEVYERQTVVNALLACKGFSIAEQLDALEWTAKERSRLEGSSAPGMSANLTYKIDNSRVTADNMVAAMRPLPGTDLKAMLGLQLFDRAEVSEELAVAVVDRISALQPKDPKLADLLRSVVLRWDHAAINMMLLRDVKNDRSSVEAVVRLLAQRAQLREKQSSDVFDLRTGTPAAVGIAACLIEDASEYQAIMDGDNVETKIAFLACARLIRAPVPVPAVAKYVRSGDKRLSLAAERYLESEDSPAARNIVLGLHPNEAKILGATSAFFINSTDSTIDPLVLPLFSSIGTEDGSRPVSQAYNGIDRTKTEERLIKEVKENADLAGVYAYGGSFVHIYKDKVLFSWDYDGSRFREREMSKSEFDQLKAYLAQHRVDEMPPYIDCGEREYCIGIELVMLSRNGGRRVFVAADKPPPFFAGLNKYFDELKETRGTVRYEMSKEIPGLEILLADDDLHAETIWKEGDDMRVAVNDNQTRKRIQAEIDKTLEEKASNRESSDENISEDEDEGDRREELVEKRLYESYSWRRIVNGADAGLVAQPPNVELIPIRDGHAVQATEEQWKARLGETEIRASDEGLFKLSRGKLTRLRDGYLASPIVTPNGKWVVAYQYSDGEGPRLIRYNLLTNRSFNVESEDYISFFPYAYISTINKVLLVSKNEEDEDYDPDEIYDAANDDPDAEEMQLLDAETGRMQPVAGEFRPLTQQTFRPLQKTSKPNEYWAAIPNTEKNETIVGIYDIKVFGFRQILRVPKMRFNSMTMWVDEPAGVLYFVYRGHLLKLPLPK